MFTWAQSRVKVKGYNFHQIFWLYSIQCTYICDTYVFAVNMRPAEQKPGTSHKYWIRVWGDFIRTGRFPAKLRLLYQCVTEGLHCIILNYEARLCYYKDAISLNSQAGQWNTETRCYGQLKHGLQKKAISQASSLYTVSFLSGEEIGNKPTVAHTAYVR